MFFFLSEKPNKRRSTLDVFRQIYSQYGFRGLFTGTVPRLIKVAPACAIMISSFEYGKIFFNRLANQQFTSSSETSESDVFISTTSQKVPSGTTVTSFNDTPVLNNHTKELL